MSKPSWISFTGLNSSGGGNGDGSFLIKAQPHSGRVERSGSVTVTGNGLDAKEINITQAARRVFVSFDEQQYTVDAEGNQNLVITGKSNSPFLNFSFIDAEEILEDSEGYKYMMKFYSMGFATAETSAAELCHGTNYNGERSTKLNLPTTYKIGSQNFGTTGSKSVGSLGEATAYPFSIALKIGANTGDTYQKVTLQVTADGGDFDQAEIKLAAGSSFLELYKDQYHTIKASVISLGAEENLEATVYVDSNTTWKVE